MKRSRPLVLNVNDHAGTRYAASRALRDHFDVVEATTGRQALTLAAAHQPDLVILDIKLPDLDGFEVCRRLKREFSTALIPVLLLSAVFTEEDDKLRGLDVGDAYLADPAPPVLLATVRALLRMRRAEEATRRAEAAQQSLFEDLPLPAWVFDAATFDLVEVNDAALKYLGYSREEFLGRSVVELRPAADAAEVMSALTTRHADTTGEWRLRTRDGDVVEAELFVRPLRIAGRELRLAVAHDLTDRNRAQAAQRESEERFRTMADVSPVIMWVTDAHGRVEFANRAYCEFFGGTLEEIRAGDWQSRVHPDDADGYVSTFSRSLRERTPFHAEARVRRADGAWRWVQSYGAPRFSSTGEYLGHVGSSPDITERKQTEETLRLSERRLRDIMNYSDAVIYLKDADGRYITVNRRYEELCRVRREDIIGRTDYDIFPREHADLYRENDRRVIEAGQPLHLEEPVVLGGRIHTFLEVKFPTFDATGAVYGVCGMATDITERKVAEDELRAADRRKDEFLAMLAHELRNPLSVITNAMAVLDRTSSPDPGPTAIRAMIRRQTKQLARLLDDLLDVARVTRGLIGLRTEPLDLRAVIGLAVEAHRGRIDVKRQRLAVSVPDGPVIVNGDPARLQQIVGNLLHNASRYTPDEGAIWLTLAVDGETALVRVRDTGSGIRTEDLVSIFEPFRRMQSPLQRSETGLGLGLTLARRLIELHGGRIEARSDGPGTGAEFDVRLPLARGLVPQGDAEARAERAVTPRRVVVIEDNDDARTALVLALQLDGHDVREAATGREGIEVALASHPAVVLVDIGLPDIDGLAVGTRLREALGPDVCLAALTGYGQPEDRKRSREAGFDAHLVKPVTADDVMRLLSEARP
jgi:PAS domain S-box-containing protein